MKRGVWARWRAGWRGVRVSLLWEALMRQKKWVWTALLMQVVNLIFNVILSFVTISMVNDGIVDQVARLEPFYVQILGMYVIAAVFSYAGGLVAARIGYELEFDIRTRLYRSIQSAELRELDAAAGGQLVTRSLTDLQLLQTTLTLLLPVIPLLPLVIAVIIILLVLSPPLAIATVAALPINLWLLRKFQNRLWGLSWAELNERAEVARAIDEPVRGIRVVKAFNSEESERRRVGEVANRTYRFSMARVRLLARYDLPLTFVPMLIQALVLLIGARLAINGRLSLGLFLLSFQGIGFVTQLATVANALASAVQYVRTAQSRLGEVIRIGKGDETAGNSLPEPDRGLEFDGVGVSLAGSSVIDHLDLAVSPGELVVLTGPPRSGKSTVAAVAAGLLVPDRGEARLDGADLRALDGTALRRVIRVVSEEPFLFATTLRENLELGAEHAVDETLIRRAVWAAGAEDLVAESANDLDTEIGDRGLTLSGGQRQRLALARALVEPPRVLVLDDALAAVNPSLEMEILRRIRQHAPSTAILYITRRPALGAIADRVVTLPPRQTSSTPDVTVTEAPAANALGAGPSDTALAAAVAGLKVGDETPLVSDEVITDPRMPKVHELMRPFIPVMIAGLVVLLVQTGAELTPTLLFGSVSDLVEDKKATQTDLRAGALVLVAAVMALCAYGYRVLNQRFTQGLVYTLRRRVFNRLSLLGIDFYDRELPGAVATRVVNDLDVFINFLTAPAFRLLTAIFMFLGGMTVIVLYSPAVAPVILVTVVLTAALSLGQVPITDRALGRARDQLGRVTAKFEEDFAGRQDIRTFGAEATQTRKFIEASRELRQRRKWATSVTVTFGEAMMFVSQATALTVLLVAGNRVLAGALSIGSALTLRLLSTTATGPLGSVGPWYSQMLDLRVSWRRLAQPFDAPILPVESTDARLCEQLTGEVEFDHVDFAYPHVGRPVLEDVSFTIPRGEVATLVGVTGAGKSSIAKLLTRMYDPTAGTVRVDGVDIRQLDLRSYRSRLGVVPQDAFLFRGTVASNIAYGTPDASIEQIDAAARAVGAHAVLTTLAGGYDHPVEEEGRNLTTAQRQLIALARAWITGPDVLVLDEATSALDPELEQATIEAVSRLGCTTLMVTHRHNVVSAADLVIMLEAGRVVAVGPPSNLDGTGGAFDRLWTGGTGEEVAEPVTPN